MKYKTFLLGGALLVAGWLLNALPAANMASAAPKGIDQLTTLPSVDLKAPGTVRLYTVPQGRQIVITNVVLRVTSASRVSQPPSIRIGRAPDYADWLGSVDLYSVNEVDTAVELNRLNGTNPQRVYKAGEVLWLDIQYPALGEEMVAEFDVFGYEI
jgi:hypothetical protein